MSNPNRFQSFCSYFIGKHDLRKYFAEDNRERNFECNICLDRFSTSYQLKYHRKVVHRFLFQQTNAD